MVVIVEVEKNVEKEKNTIGVRVDEGLLHFIYGRNQKEIV